MGCESGIERETEREGWMGRDQQTAITTTVVVFSLIKIKTVMWGNQSMGELYKDTLVVIVLLILQLFCWAPLLQKATEWNTSK